MEQIETAVSSKPAAYRRWHKWQWGWQKWLALVSLIDKLWPRNP